MFREISDEFWKIAEPLPEPFMRTRPGGLPALPFRIILNGIFYLLKTVYQWNMIPVCYGSKTTIHEHFRRWSSGGVFDILFQLNANVIILNTVYEKVNRQIKEIV
ncbi:MAG: transposase [Desulfococcaceae bacterium]|nr:transposase [Desulfococcaceae bacterium]